MAVFNTYTPGSGQFDNTITVTDGGGSFTNETDANGAETKALKSDIVEFGASGDDSKGALTTTASGTPPGVSGVDEGSGKLHLAGTPSNSIIPTYDISLYAKDNPPTISTGGTPATYRVGDQVNIYKKFDVTVTSKHKASASVTVPIYIVKDWNEEKDNFLAYVDQEYPE
jgi:hypothetical protein